MSNPLSNERASADFFAGMRDQTERQLRREFANGELLLHHRYEQGSPITCGAPYGCVTSVVKDVQCSKCREVLAAFPEDPQECDHGRWNPDNGQCLDCGHIDPKDLPRAVTRG